MSNVIGARIEAAAWGRRRLFRWPVLYFSFALFVLDAFVMGQGLVAAVILLCVGACLLPKAYLFSLAGRNNRPILRIAGGLVIAAVAIMLTINFNNRVAQDRAERLVAAIESYRAVNGSYPVDLDRLVPGYVEDVPIAKYTLSFNRFVYLNRGDRVILGYVDVPPFGRPYYDFLAKRWLYLEDSRRPDHFATAAMFSPPRAVSRPAR